MKTLLTIITLATITSNANALVSLKNNGVTSGNKQDFKTLSDIKESDVVCAYVKRRYVPITKKAVELAQGKTCRNIGKVGVDYIGINSSTRNSHLYTEVLKAIN